METRILVKKGVKTNKPVLVVGLPGIGSVGLLVVQQMRRQHKAEKIASLYSRHLPSYVTMTKKGGIRLANNSFYVIRQKQGDIVLLTGNCQAATPEGQYEVNSRAIDFFANKLEGRYVYTIGGYLPGTPRLGKPRVFGNTTSGKVREAFKNTGVLFGQSKGAIWGSAGMLLAFAKMRKLEGICLLGEASAEVDAAAAKEVAEVLSKRLHIRINTEGMDKLIHATENAAIEMSKQLSAQEEERSRKPSYIR